MTGQTKNEGAPAPARIWTVTMRDETDQERTETVEAATLEAAAHAAEELTRSWIREGFAADDFYKLDEAGENGIEAPFVATVKGYWEIMPASSTEVAGAPDDSGHLTIELKIDHEALVRAVGGNPDCQHEWKAEGPRQGSNTALINSDRCLNCGLQRWTTTYSDRRQRDTVRYQQPKYWCAKCRSDEDPCACEQETEE